MVSLLSRRSSAGSFNRTPQNPTLPLRWLQSITASVHIFLTLCYLLLSFKMFRHVEAADPLPRFIPPHSKKEPRQENYLLSWFLSLKVCKIRCGGKIGAEFLNLNRLRVLFVTALWAIPARKNLILYLKHV